MYPYQVQTLDVASVQQSNMLGSISGNITMECSKNSTHSLFCHCYPLLCVLVPILVCMLLLCIFIVLTCVLMRARKHARALRYKQREERRRKFSMNTMTSYSGGKDSTDDIKEHLVVTSPMKCGAPVTSSVMAESSVDIAQKAEADFLQILYGSRSSGKSPCTASKISQPGNLI